MTSLLEKLKYDKLLKIDTKKNIKIQTGGFSQEQREEIYYELDRTKLFKLNNWEDSIQSIFVDDDFLKKHYKTEVDKMTKNTLKIEYQEVNISIDDEPILDNKPVFIINDHTTLPLEKINEYINYVSNIDYEDLE